MERFSVSSYTDVTNFKNDSVFGPPCTMKNYQRLLRDGKYCTCLCTIILKCCWEIQRRVGDWQHELKQSCGVVQKFFVGSWSDVNCAVKKAKKPVRLATGNYQWEIWRHRWVPAQYKARNSSSSSSSSISIRTRLSIAAASVYMFASELLTASERHCSSARSSAVKEKNGVVFLADSCQRLLLLDRLTNVLSHFLSCAY